MFLGVEGKGSLQERPSSQQLGVRLRVPAGPKNPKHPSALPVQLTGSMTPSQVPLGGGGWAETVSLLKASDLGLNDRGAWKIR